ncbi:MAG TPA: ABC transporter permease [Vicinamibacterales bacterium]|nr:ABC transporter permease [Vicinamibacterales bacterium]
MRDWQAFVRDRLALPDLTPAREARVVRELAAQLEDFYRDALARGLGADEADAYACDQIRDWARMASDVRRANVHHLIPRLDRLADLLPSPPSTPISRVSTMIIANAPRDIRHAIRQLFKTPAFTLVAVLTLALGIGATTAIFSVVNGVLLRPLPFSMPDQLVRVHEVVPQYGTFSVAPANFLDWRQQQTVFSRIAAYSSASATFTDGETAERIPGAQVSWDLIELLGVGPARGAGFTAAQDAPGANRVLVISHGLWQRRFGGDPGVVGRTVTVNGQPMTILGVMPEGFYFPSRAAEFWQPIAINPANPTRGGHFLGVVARMKPDVALEQARAEMKAIAERLAVQYPESSANESAEVVLLHEQIVGAIRPALITLLGAVAVVVLIACANVANLLLVRASVRDKEVAIRAALGAGRGRIVLQMLAESVVLSVTGGLLGLLLAYLAITPIQALGAGSIPRVADIAIEGRVLAFALAASVLTGLLFGVVPAWHAARSGLGAILKDSSRSSTAASGQWIRNGLLVGEVALSIVLLVGAALLLRSFARLTSVDPGFRPENVLAFQVSLPPATYNENPKRIAFFDSLLERLTSTPGIAAAGMVQTIPIRGSYVLSVGVQGRPPAKPGEEASANHRVVTPDYFKTLGIPLQRGRTFTPQDSDTGKPVAVVDEAFVKRHFPNEDPIGHGLNIGNGTNVPYEIVGVVGNVHHGGLDAVPAPSMYVPYKQDVFSTMWVVARTPGDPTLLTGPVRQTLRQLDPALPAYSITPLATVVSDSVAQRRFSMLLLALFALIALFLAAVGLYGVVAYTVSQRTREIGLRMAIGAAPGQVLRMVIGGGMKLALVGVILGLAGAVALARLVETLLFDVASIDPMSYAGTAALLLVVAMLACYFPARRAMRVDPLIALQSE